MSFAFLKALQPYHQKYRTKTVTVPKKMPNRTKKALQPYRQRYTLIPILKP